MKKIYVLPLFVFLLAGFLGACQSSASAQIKQVTVEEAQTVVSSKDVQFIDVRTSEEFSGGHAAKAKLFPLDSLGKDLEKLDKNKPVYLICRTGRRSQSGAEILEKAGFKELYNITGGTVAWEKAGLPMEKP